MDILRAVSGRNFAYARATSTPRCAGAPILEEDADAGSTVWLARALPRRCHTSLLSSGLRGRCSLSARPPTRSFLYPLSVAERPLARCSCSVSLTSPRVGCRCSRRGIRLRCRPSFPAAPCDRPFGGALLFPRDLAAPAHCSAAVLLCASQDRFHDVLLHWTWSRRLPVARLQFHTALSI